MSAAAQDLYNQVSIKYNQVLSLLLSISPRSFSEIKLLWKLESKLWKKKESLEGLLVLFFLTGIIQIWIREKKNPRGIIDFVLINRTKTKTHFTCEVGANGSGAGEHKDFVERSARRGHQELLGTNIHTGCLKNYR